MVRQFLTNVNMVANDMLINHLAPENGPWCSFQYKDLKNGIRPIFYMPNKT